MAALTVLGTSDSIVVKLSGAPATTQPTYHASYVDTTGDTTTDNPTASTYGAFNSTTEVTAVSAPGANKRQVDFLRVYNDDTATVIATVMLANGANRYVLGKYTITSGSFIDVYSLGTVGATGSAGAAGAAGSVGAQGAFGLDGFDGDPGEDGYSGFDGPMGATGATGATGPAGADGRVGSDGLDGQDADDFFMVPPVYYDFSSGNNGLVPASGGGTSNFLRADGAWAAPAAGAGGSTTQVQYNNAGALAGSSTFTFDGTTWAFDAPVKLAGGDGLEIDSGVPGVTTEKLYNNAGTLMWDDAVLGSAGTPYSYWDADKAPTSPTSEDDEFNTAGAIDGKWTTVNWASATTTPNVNQTVPGALYIAVTNDQPFIAAVQAIPAGDFCIVAKCKTVDQQASPNHNIGMLLADGASAGAGSQTVLIIDGGYSTQESWSALYAATNYANIGAGVASGYGPPNLYGRIRRSGSTYYWGWSPDGMLWSEFTSAPGYTPTHFGLFINTAAAGLVECSFDFFRYEATATPTATKGGTRTIGFGGYTAVNVAGDSMLGVLATAGSSGGLSIPSGVPGTTANTLYSYQGQLLFNGGNVGAPNLPNAAAPATEGIATDRPQSLANMLGSFAYNPAAALLSARSFL